ncbi:PQQ-dependent sugar dehydrogenase [Pseudonocardia sp. NPDC046786]|uniref:PQQ-dependent sugar dehydrogenase n=1 Tax=Pseudonocardia sp. NPDC046786 TaxID=3155471 RepID=UPI0033F78B1D
MPVPSGRARLLGAGVPLVAALALLAGCTGGGAEPQPGADTPDGPELSSASVAPADGLLPQATAGEPEILATGLSAPWAVAFLPDGDALVTERDTARILRLSPDGELTPLGVVDQVTPQGEGGLLGIAVSPDFATDDRVLVYYTAADGNRIVALTMADDGTIDGADQQTVIDGIPSGFTHNGGALVFGPDGELFVGTGDAGDRSRSQDPDDLAGKILRLTADGAAAPGNPFGTEVYALGIRNSQGIAFGPDGEVFATEFGARTADEINLIEPGRNYGWSEVEGPQEPPIDDAYTEPLLVWPVDQASPSGLAQAGGSLWMGALRGERLWRIPIGAGDGAAGTVGEPEQLLNDDFGRLRGVTATPDGSALWITTSNRDGRGNPTADDDRIIVLPLE